jgi:hypothetical protein
MYFIETHHYDGGLKVGLFGKAARPAWAPPSEAIIVSTELELGPEEFAVEFSRFASDESSCVTWIGCYMKSEDRQYGDRSNYVAAGLWLRDAVVFESGELISALRDGLRALHQQGLTQELAARFEQFTKGLVSQIVPRRQFPAGASGIEAATSFVGPRKLFIADAKASDLNDAIESAVLNLSLSRAPFSPASRVVVWVRGTQGLPGIEPMLPSPRELLVPFAVDLPNVIESSAQKYSALVDNFSSASAQASKLQNALADKQKALETADANFRALKDENFQLQSRTKKLEGLPYTGISSQLEGIRAEITLLRRSVESIRPSVAQTQPRPESRMPTGSPRTRNRAPYVMYAGVAIAALVGCGVLVFLVLKILF